MSIADTHCHLGDPAFADDFVEAVRRAAASGVTAGLVCGTSPDDWDETCRAACRAGWCFGLGIFPGRVNEEDADRAVSELGKRIESELSDPETRLAAIAEIGLDGTRPKDVQSSDERLFMLQLGLAREFGLPVSVHSRGAVSRVIDCVRKSGVRRGVLHAFGGSFEQAGDALKLGFKIGFGGTVSYAGSRRVRSVLARLPGDAFVLETDSPWMPGEARRRSGLLRTEPADAALYLREAALIRGEGVPLLESRICGNSLSVFPKLGRTLHMSSPERG